ncbi:DUF2652 domain-containing protein [Fulvivirga sp. 29W222]|uniref:DUF2652 domain-containing protein n=1 Tax=Fulvivirga marina TaxID=2494733 RepID=A0A937G1W3_9BACT|nr:DUF2652 domain-containing protein [Fulvivirga marina]MBL6448538.1 DUF2652 domain-containing protein [Fulvivirga marina]
MEVQPQKGYILLADISGYTAFMANSELAHAPLVLSHIIQFLTKELTPTLQLAEVEGDALFLYATEEAISRGELLLELVESTYVNFRINKRTMIHNITCPCRACQEVANLDLKFVVHYGEFMLQRIAGKVKPVGSSVNLAHRLLKNKVTDTTGWKGYVLFSNICMDKMGISPSSVHHGHEHYQHFGKIETTAVNFEEKYVQYTANCKDYISDDQADVCIEHTFTAPPPIIWDWLNDPNKRNLWYAGSKANWVKKDRPEGRTGPASNNHCTNSNFIEHILDWRPFRYYTVCNERGWVKAKITGELYEQDGGTHYKWRVRLLGILPRSILRLFSRFITHSVLQMNQSLDKMEQLSCQALMKGMAQEVQRYKHVASYQEA